jgi:glycine hydroxymethyltransferase
MILAPRRSPLTERVDAAVFPGTQGGPLMHVIAAKAVAFQEALEPEFAAYQRQTLANARVMAKVLVERGFPIMTGGTENHMLLVDLRGTGVDAARAERALHGAHIAVNRASLPGDAGSEPTQGDGGLRLGTPAVTTRGLGEPEIRTVAGWIADVLDAGGADSAVARVRAEVVKMCASFPVYGAQ